MNLANGRHSAKQKNILLISGIVLLVVAVLGYWYWKNQRKQTVDTHAIEDGEEEKIFRLVPVGGNPHYPRETVSAQIEITEADTPATVFPLKLGSKGREVEQLQIYLMKREGGFTHEQISGELDEYTLRRMKELIHRDQMSEQNFYKRQIDQERTYKYQSAC